MNINTSHLVRTHPDIDHRPFSDLKPGIFMGLMASFLFLVIMYIGINALSSLEVPYAAFEKDTSATVQKKQQ